MSFEQAVADFQPRRTRLYFECHITTEPVFGLRLCELVTIARTYGFRVAELLVQTSRTATPQRSDKDTFATSISTDYDDIYLRMSKMIEALKDSGFTVWRAKIEDALFDTKHGDPWP